MGYKLTVKALIISVIALVISCVGAVVVYADYHDDDCIVKKVNNGSYERVYLWFPGVNTNELDGKTYYVGVTLYKYVEGEYKYFKGTSRENTYYDGKDYDRAVNVSENGQYSFHLKYYYYDDDGHSHTFHTDTAGFRITTFDNEYPVISSNYDSSVYKNEEHLTGTLSDSDGSLWQFSCTGQADVVFSDYVEKYNYDIKVTSNGTYNFMVKDCAGHTTYKTITVSNIDITSPQLEITYDNNPTNKNVILCVSATDSESGIKEITLPDGNITSKQSTDYEVTQNGEYIFTVTDNAGNTATKTITVSNIDKIAPQLEITYDNNPTNENITLCVSATDSESGIKEITLPDGNITSKQSTDYEVTENSEYIFTATDNAGNTATKTITVSNIDKIAPQLEITYDNNPTNKNITLSVSATDSESGVKEITLPNGSITSKQSTDYEVTQNGEYIFTATDNAGNTATKTITVSNIDKIAPQLEITYDNNPTNENITLSVSVTDGESGIKEITLPDGNTTSEKSAEYEVTENGEYIFTATDNAGNITTKTINVSNIDKIVPQLEITYDNNPTNENISLSISAIDSESGIKEITLPDGSIVTEETAEYEVTENSEYTFTATDNAGNITTKTITVSCIDKDLPIISSHNIDYKENKIFVTLEAKEENLTYLISESQDIENLEFKTQNIFELLSDGTYYAFAKDNVGNISLPYEIVVNSPLLPQISVDAESGEFEGSVNVTISVTSQDTELKNYKYIVTPSLDYPLPEDTWITPDTTDPQTVTINTEGEQYIHVFASDVFGNINTKTFGAYIITPKPTITQPPKSNNTSSKTINLEPSEETIETEEVITTKPIEMIEEQPIETRPLTKEIITPEIPKPEKVISNSTENTNIEKKSKEIPVLVIGNEDKNFTLYQEDIEGVETIQVLDDKENKIAEFEPEKIEEIKVNPPKKDGYEFVGYKKNHLETHLILIPTYEATYEYDDTEISDISPNPISKNIVTISNLNDKSILFIRLIYTIAILAIIVLILSIIALTYKISNLRADRNSR